MQQRSPEILSLVFKLALLMGATVSGAAHAAHPFITDDTGTQGTGHWQLELNTDHTRVKEDGVMTRNQVANGTLTYGITDTLDLAANLPYQRNKTGGESAVKGIGDATVQAKWRVFENEQGWSVALKPAVTFPTGNDNKGLGAGRSTESLNALVQYQKDAWTWLVNGGATYNDNKVGNRKNLWNASTAVLYSPTEQWTLGADVGVSRNPDQDDSKNLSYGLLGVQYHVSKNTDVDLGYRRSLQSGPVQHTVGAGLTMRW